MPRIPHVHLVRWFNDGPAGASSMASLPVLANRRRQRRGSLYARDCQPFSINAVWVAQSVFKTRKFSYDTCLAAFVPTLDLSHTPNALQVGAGGRCSTG